MQSVLGAECTLDPTWWLNRNLTLIFGKQQTFPTLSYNKPRFCPHCLEENNFHLAFWELPLVLACPSHRCVLLTQCTACSRKLNWTDIAPGWRCRCGKSITHMETTLATSGFVAIARLVAQSKDVVLPHYYDTAFDHTKIGNYCLMEAYSALDWATELSEIIKERIIFENYPYQRVFKRSTSNRGWEANLLIASPEIIFHRLVRALRNKFKTSEEMLTYVSAVQGFGQAISFIDHSPNNNFFKEKVIAVLRRFLSTYRLNTEMSGHLFFNPRQSNQYRNQCLKKFGIWWSMLSQQIASLDPAISKASSTHSATHYEDLIIFQCLSVIMAASQRSTDIDQFRSFTHWWRVPDELRECEYSNELLVRLTNHLASRSRVELEFMYSHIVKGRLTLG